MKDKNIYLFILGALFIFVFHPVLSFTPLAANDFPYLSQSELFQRFSLPYAWWNRGSQGFGEYTIPFLWVWPMDFLYGLAAYLGLSFSLIQRLLGIIPVIILGAIGIRKLLKHYSLNETSVLVGTLIYILNTYFILLIDGGQLAFALSYAWLPFVFLGFVRAYENYNARTIFIAALSVSVFVLTDIRYVYLAFLLFGVFIFYQFLILPSKDYFSIFGRLVVLVGLSTIMLIGILAYMIIPAFFAQGANLPSGYADISQTNFLGFTTIANAILLLQPHWYENVFGQLSELQWQFVLFPLLAFSAPILNRKNKTIGFWLIVSILGIFLTKGSLEPFGEVYTWLFTNFPGFSLFRDSTKFYVFIALSYTVLSSYTIHALSKSKLLGIIIGIAAVSISLLITSPVWQEKMTGILSSPRHLDSFRIVASQLSSDQNFGRILWIPGRTPLSYADVNHPSVESSRLLSLRPFAIGVVGNYELFNFLRDAPFMNQILRIAAVSYVAYPYPDEKRFNLKEDENEYYNTFLNQLSSSDWSAGLLSSKPFPILKTMNAVDRLFLAPNHFYVVGSDRIYWDLSNGSSFDLSKNVLTFAEEAKTEIPLNSSIILYNKKKIDLVLTQIPKERFIFPAKNIPFEPKVNGWWKRNGSDVIQWRAFLQEKYSLDSLDFDYGGGWSVAEGVQTLEIKNEKIKPGMLLFARVMTSSHGGKIEFTQGNTTLGQINTIPEEIKNITLKNRGWEEIPDTTYTYEDTNVSWYEAAKLANNEPITIKTSGDLNVINALAVISEEDLRSANEYSSSYEIYDWNFLTEIEKEELLQLNSTAELTYERISPVHYKVRVEGITGPQTIVFSESYDSLWRLNDQKSFSAYSMINGFQVDQNGEYDLYFSAQKYVNYGLYISGVTIIILISLLLYFKRGTMNK